MEIKKTKAIGFSTWEVSQLLPPLPKQIAKREADFGLRFRAWVEANKEEFLSGQPFELKHSRGKDSIPFSCFEDHQQAFNLSIAKNGELIRIDGKRGEPDYIFTRDPAFIVINYPSAFCVIEMNTFLLERKMSKRKSLTLSRAKAISLYVG